MRRIKLRIPLTDALHLSSRVHRTKPLCRIITSSFPLILLLSNVCHGLVETCEQLQAAFDLTKTEDVVIEIHPYDNIVCDVFTTMTMDSNSLTVKPSEDISSIYTNLELDGIRFNVTNGAKLSWEPSVEFIGSGTQDVNGGALYVGEGSTAHFLSRLEMTDVRIASVTDDADFATYSLSGGCLYTDGYLRVDGAASFTGCENAGGGESSPGPGGAMYVGPDGSVLFKGTVAISDTHLTNEGGDYGGGIYNEGKVNIKGAATFTNVWALRGSAIYNAVGGTVNFRNKAAAQFVDCSEPEHITGALFNEGYMAFTGPTLFYDSGYPAITISSDGETVLSAPLVFWASFGDNEPFVQVESGGQLVIPGSALFINNDEADCSTVYYKETDTCL